MIDQGICYLCLCDKNFSNKVAFAFLEELSSIDVDLHRIEEHLDRHKKGLSGMQTEVKSLEERVKADRETLTAMDKTRSELSAELRQMTYQIERSREKLGRSEAMRQAMLSYLNDTSTPGSAYPALWGPFAVIGEGAAR